MLEGINYLHKIPDQYLKNININKLLELWTLWLEKKGKKEKRIVNTKELLSQL